MTSENSADLWAKTLIDKAEKIGQASNVGFTITDDERKSLTQILESFYSDYDSSLGDVSKHDDIRIEFDSQLEEWNASQIQLMHDNPAINLIQTTAKRKLLEFTTEGRNDR